MPKGISSSEGTTQH